MNIDAEWHIKMQALKIQLEGLSDVMRHGEQLVHQWVKEFLDERSNQP